MGWPVSPVEDKFRSVLTHAPYVELAIDGNRLIGFVYAHTDGEISAYVPLLEVLPDYQRRGVATELVTRLLARLAHFYMVDLTCDDDMLPFYARFQLLKTNALMRRTAGALRPTSD